MAFTLVSLSTLISTSALLNFAQASPLPALEPRSTPASIPCKATYWSVPGDTCKSIGLGWGLYDYQIHEANTFLNCEDIWNHTPICIPDIPLPPTVTYSEPAVPTPTCKTTYYSKAGDTCRSIGLPSGLYDYQIYAANPFLNCNDIWVGTPICIPDVPLPITVTYTDEPQATPTPPPATTPSCQFTYWSVADDTCDSLGAKFGVTADAIHNANSFLTCNDIWVNTPICVPFPNPTITISATPIPLPTPTCKETYISAEGDTCESIAHKYELSASDIYNANTFLNCGDIWTYTPVCIPDLPIIVPFPPCQQNYISAEGDTCSSIAEKYLGVSAEAILAANTFLNCEDIWTYTHICIPWGVITDYFPTPVDPITTDPITYDPDTNLPAITYDPDTNNPAPTDPITYDPDTNLAITYNPDTNNAAPTYTVD